MMDFDVAAHVFVNAPDPEGLTVSELKTLMRSNFAKCSMAMRDKFMFPIGGMTGAMLAIRYVESVQGGQQPMIDAERAIRGITKQALVNEITAQTNALVATEAQIAGTEGKYRDALALLTTARQIFDMNWSAGWPTA